MENGRPARTYGIVNLTKYQHYKKRNPPWIKAYAEWLQDHEWACLSDGAKWFMVASILLASRYRNFIPHDSVWLWGQTGSASAGAVAGYIDELKSCGLIELHDASNMLASCKQVAIPETETETEEERGRERALVVVSVPPKRKNARAREAPKGFDRFWQVYPRKASKGDAEKAWIALAPDEALQDEIHAAVLDQRGWIDWNRDGGKFIPYPASWLRAKGWANRRPEVLPAGLFTEKGVHNLHAAKLFLERDRDDDR